MFRLLYKNIIFLTIAITPISAQAAHKEVGMLALAAKKRPVAKLNRPIHAYINKNKIHKAMAKDRRFSECSLNPDDFDKNFFDWLKAKKKN